MPATCWTLAYDACIPGYTSRNDLPQAVTLNEPRVRRCRGTAYLAAACLAGCRLAALI